MPEAAPAKSATQTIRMKRFATNKHSVRYMPDPLDTPSPLFQSVYLMKHFAPGADVGKLPEVIEISVKAVA